MPDLHKSGKGIKKNNGPDMSVLDASLTNYNQPLEVADFMNE